MMKWGGKLWGGSKQVNVKSRFVESSIYRQASCVTYGNSSRILDQSSERKPGQVRPREDLVDYSEAQQRGCSFLALSLLPKYRFSPYVHIRYLPSNVREIDNYGGGGFMVWAPLHVFESGSVIGVTYRDEVLEPYFRVFRRTCGPEYILMDDNVRLRRALLIDEFLESEDIRRKVWPARSPDLNPIEHVWDDLGRAIATPPSPPRTIQEMKTVLLNEWG
ncbi:transposable element Tcb2 transposase [Trichonephila clavipes]|uniref:Transposable element Tcb2 transposase n=1 Tax=Trichonephila clavipes TaxID=2585209 RepID=A0A8X6VFF3_TRICX|nr:transposable element Tcb2 transposase [Trichonephila clavipes]